MISKFSLWSEVIL